MLGLQQKQLLARETTKKRRQQSHYEEAREWNNLATTTASDDQLEPFGGCQKIHYVRERELTFVGLQKSRPYRIQRSDWFEQQII